MQVKTVARYSACPWQGFGLRFKNGPAHLVRSIDWQRSRLEVFDGKLVLVAEPSNNSNPTREFVVGGADYQALRALQMHNASFWTYALGRNRIPGIIREERLSLVEVSDFSRAVMEWVRSGNEGPCPVYTQTVIGPLGGIDLETAEGAMLWRKVLNQPGRIGSQVLLVAAREADDFVCYSLHPETREIIAFQYIDPDNGLLFSYLGSLQNPVKREYAARINGLHRTKFGDMPILWTLKNLPGHIGKWITDEMGQSIVSLGSHNNANIPFRQVTKGNGEQQKTVAVIAGKDLGSPAWRFEGIAGRVKIPIVSLGEGKFGLGLTRGKVHLHPDIVKGAGFIKGDSAEVTIDGEHIVAYHIPGQPIDVKLVSRFSYEEDGGGEEVGWRLLAAEIDKVSPEYFQGLTMVQGLRLARYYRGPTYPFLGFKVGGSEAYRLCWLPKEEVSFPKHVSAVFRDKELVFFSPVYRFRKEDLPFLISLGTIFSLPPDQLAEQGNREIVDILLDRTRKLEAKGSNDAKTLALLAGNYLAAFANNSGNLKYLSAAMGAYKQALELSLNIPLPVPREGQPYLVDKEVDFRALVAGQTLRAWERRIDIKIYNVIRSFGELEEQLRQGSISREVAWQKLARIKAVLDLNIGEIRSYCGMRRGMQQYADTASTILEQEIPRLKRLLETNMGAVNTETLAGWGITEAVLP